MKAFARVIWLPATVILVTCAWIGLDRAVGWRGPRSAWTGAILISLGTLLALWCAWLFLRLGHGSPHPFTAKTQCLVEAGPYRWVRNPMMWGVGGVLSGLALLLGSVGLWFGIGMFVIFVRWFVPAYEEPDMEKRFGAAYRDYCARVPRWFPRRGG